MATAKEIFGRKLPGPSAADVFAPKQEELQRAQKLQSFFTGKPRTDDLFEGTALLDPLRGFLEGAQGLAAGAAKFGGFIADQVGEPDIADAARNVASAIEFETTRGFEAKGRGITSRSFAEHPFRKTLRLGGQAIPSLLTGFGGGAVATKALLKAGFSGAVARELGFTLSTIPLAAVSAGDFYQEGLDAGKTPQELLGKTAAVLTGTAVLERAVPLTWWINGVGGGRKIIKTALQESGEEIAQQLWTNTFKVMGWKGTEDLYHKMMDGVAESMVGGLIGGGLAGSVSLVSRPPKIEVEPATTQQIFEIMKARGVKNDKGEDVTLEDVQLQMAEGVKRVQKEQNSVIKNLFESRGKIPNINAMLQARQDKPHYEEATLQKDVNTGDNVVVLREQGEHNKKLGGLLGSMVNETLKTGKTISKKDMDALVKAEQQRKRSVKEAYEKLDITTEGRHLAFDELPSAFQAIIENEGPSNPVDLQAFIEQEREKWVVYFMGGEADSERGEVFFGPLTDYRRLGWRSEEWTKGNVSPFAFIRDFVNFMAQVNVTNDDGSVTRGIRPDQLVVRGDNADRVFKTILDQYSETTIGKPSDEIRTAAPKEVEPAKPTAKTISEIIAEELEIEFSDRTEEQKQSLLDKKVADGEDPEEVALNENIEENSIKFRGIPQSDKIKSDRSRLAKFAFKHWTEYGSPQAYVDAMTLAMNDAWLEVQKNVRGVSRQNNAIYQIVLDRSELDFRGMPIDSVDNAVMIAALFRNPSVEISQVIYVKDGRVIDHTAHTLNIPFESAISSAFINATIQRNGADGYYLVHNHPSGNPSLSPGDVKAALRQKKINEGQITVGYEAMRGKYKGVIATDGEQYNFIGPGVSEDDHVTYINTKRDGLPKLREDNPVVGNFQRQFQNKQIDFLQDQNLDIADLREAFGTTPAGEQPNVLEPNAKPNTTSEAIEYLRSHGFDKLMTAIAPYVDNLRIEYGGTSAHHSSAAVVKRGNEILIRMFDTSIPEDLAHEIVHLALDNTFLKYTLIDNSKSYDYRSHDYAEVKILIRNLLHEMYMSGQRHHITSLISMGQVSENGDPQELFTYALTNSEFRARLTKEQKQRIEDYFYNKLKSMAPGEENVILPGVRENFLRSEITIILGDAQSRFLEHVYLDKNAPADDIGLLIAKYMQEHKASTYVLVLDEQKIQKSGLKGVSGSGMINAINKQEWSFKLPGAMTDLMVRRKGLSGKLEIVSLKSKASTKQWQLFSGSGEGTPQRASPFDPLRSLHPVDQTALINSFKGTPLGRQLNVNQEQKEAQDNLIARANQQVAEGGIQDLDNQNFQEAIPGFPDAVRREDYANVPAITLEKVGSLDEALSLKIRLNILQEFKRAYDSNDAAEIKELEENLDAYMDETGSDKYMGLRLILFTPVVTSCPAFPGFIGSIVVPAWMKVLMLPTANIPASTEMIKAIFLLAGRSKPAAGSSYEIDHIR